MPADRLAYPVTVATGRVWTACPQPATAAVSTKETCVYFLGLSNTTAGALDVTITDNAGSPLTAIVITLAAKSVQFLSPQGGMIFASGLKIGASGAGVTYTLNAESTVT